jgi:hypothetical protein
MGPRRNSHIDSTEVPLISGRELTTPLTFCHAQSVKEFPVRGLTRLEINTFADTLLVDIQEIK